MTVHIFDTMGTTVSVRVLGGVDEHHNEALEGIERVFQLYDSEYSLYKPESPLSRLAAGDVALTDLSHDIRDTYARAIEWRQRTHGAFTPHRPDGIIDLSGIVKADAIAAAGAVLRAHGVESYSVNAGGDMATRGEPEAWTTGITSPTDSGSLAAVVALGGDWSAIATSGTSEWGEHIWRSTATGPQVVQATVVSNDIVASDVWATAIVSGGLDVVDLATNGADACAVLVLCADGEVRANPSMVELISAANTAAAR